MNTRKTSPEGTVIKEPWLTQHDILLHPGKTNKDYPSSFGMSCSCGMEWFVITENLPTHTCPLSSKMKLWSYDTVAFFPDFGRVVEFALGFNFVPIRSMYGYSEGYVKRPLQKQKEEIFFELEIWRKTTKVEKWRRITNDCH